MFFTWLILFVFVFVFSSNCVSEWERERDGRWDKGRLLWTCGRLYTHLTLQRLDTGIINRIATPEVWAFMEIGSKSRQHLGFGLDFVNMDDWWHGFVLLTFDWNQSCVFCDVSLWPWGLFIYCISKCLDWNMIRCVAKSVLFLDGERKVKGWVSEKIIDWFQGETVLKSKNAIKSHHWGGGGRVVCDKQS